MIFRRWRISFFVVVYLFVCLLASLCWFSQFVCRKIVKTACIGLCFRRETETQREKERERTTAATTTAEVVDDAANTADAGWKWKARQQQQQRTKCTKKEASPDDTFGSLGAMHEGARSADWIDPNSRTEGNANGSRLLGWIPNGKLNVACTETAIIACTRIN